MHVTHLGQEVAESPPAFQLAEQQAVRDVAAASARYPVVFHFMWTLGADRKARIQLFTSADDMYAAHKQKNSNFSYEFLFDRTGPVWPNPGTSSFGCHAVEWEGGCPATVGHTVVGQAIAYTRAQNLQAARQSIGYAYGLFIRAGYTPRQAIQQINSLVQTFSSLE